MDELLEGIRVLLSVSFLLYASWSDWKRREVSNRVWLFFAPLALAFTTAQYMLFSPLSVAELLFNYVLSVALTFAISTFLFYAGAFGGADAKALMCLALALPNHPGSLFQFHIESISPILPLTTFSNAVLLAAFSVVYAALRNSLWKLKTGKGLFEGFENVSIWRKILVFLSGYKLDATKLRKNVYVYPLEDINVKEDGKNETELLIWPKDEKREVLVDKILAASQEGKLPNHVWVTPGLPLLIFITAGLIVALMFGDMVWLLLRVIWGW